MLLNLDKYFIDLAGKTMEDSPKMSMMLAERLAASSDNNPVKYYDIAQNLYKNGQIEIDRSDLDLLIAFIQIPNKGFNNLSSGQLLTELEKLKLESMKK